MNNSSYAVENLPLQHSQVPAFVWWIVSGLMNSAVSVWIITVLVAWKPIHGDTLKFTVQLTVAEGLASITNVAIGLFHVKKALNDEAETDSQFNCWFKVGVDFFFVLLLALLCLVISLDRFLAAVFPIRYQHRPPYYCFLLSSVAWIISGLLYTASFFAASKTVLIPVCQVSQSIASWFYNIYKYSSFVLSLFSVLLYFLTLLVLKYQMVNVAKKGGSIAEIKHRMHSKVRKVLAVNAVAHLGTFTVADFGTGVVTMFTNQGPLFGPYFASLYFVGCLSCLPIYLIFQQQFRQGSLELASKIVTLKCANITFNKIQPSSSVLRT